MNERILALIKQDLMGRGLLMEIESNSTILGKFISKAIEEIYMKYSTISKGEERLVSALIEKVEAYQVDFDTYLDYDRTKVLAGVLADEENKDIIKLYILLTSNLKIRVGLEEVKAFYDTLENEGYMQIDKYLFYYDHGEARLKEMAEANLTEDLEDVDYALELFDSEEIAYMWIFQTSLASAAKQFIQDNGWFEALDIENLGTAFLDKFDSEIYYCLNPNEFVFK